MKDFKPKSFWKRPEGTTGALFMFAIIGLVTYLMVFGGGIAFLTGLAWGALQITIAAVLIAALLYMVFDPKVRNLIWYGYKSVMRKITGAFVKIDPISILKSYVDDLRGNLRKMSKQISNLRGQMHRLKTLMRENNQQIQDNLELANRAKAKDKKQIMVLKARKAGRLKESNLRLDELYKKMEVMYRVLVKMYGNSEILLEDVADQVKVKEQERKAIRASHGAMMSARNIIAGNSDKRIMFDMALEAIAEDVDMKIGEMERFMDLSANFMDSIDLQNGVFEEEGLTMLEKWEKESESVLLSDEEKVMLLDQANDESQILDLDEPIAKPIPAHANQYDSLFDDE